MRRILGLFLLALALNGCDDGDVSVETFDFSEIAAHDCGDIIYKINDREALFFVLGGDGSFENAFPNEPTIEGAPRIFNISAENRIFYRAYDGTVSANNFCTPIPPTTPNVTEEWIVTSGRIEITTEAVIVQNTNPDFPGGEMIQKYSHHIVFKDITWDRPGNEQFEESFDFGFYDTFPSATLLDFNFDDQLDQCATPLIYNFVGREGLTLAYDPALVVNAATPIGEPRVCYLDATNILTYRMYNPNDPTLLTADNFCGGATLPEVVETWVGVNGEPDNLTGRIEVTTTTNGPGSYLHEIHLKAVTLQKGSTAVYLADDYLMGQLITTD